MERYEDLEALGRRLLRLLQGRHAGQARKVGADGLYAELYGEAPRHKINDTYRVRQAVRELRRRGELICSDNSGYWWPADAAELEATAQRLEDRGKASLAQAAALRRGAGRLRRQTNLWET